MASRLEQFEAAARDMETVVAEVGESGNPELRRRVGAVVNALLTMYRFGWEEALELARRRDPELVELWSRNPILSPLLVVHDLHPRSLSQRVEEALERVRPYLASHGGGVRLLGVEGGRVRLALEGHCAGCPSSRVTVEEALRRELAVAAPDLEELVVEGEAGPPRVLQGLPAAAAGWVEVEGLEDPGPSGVRVLDLDGHAVLLLRCGGDWYAFHRYCPRCDRPAAFQRRQDLLVCQGCGTAYDPRKAGREADGGGGHLEPVPLLVQGNRAKLALVGG
ncbi:putative Rieske domain-containing protein [Candidatus Hydrogenisulfobacillus filiaventi]|uniref:Putative Rieske domain-containing protein n=1 Tax=Candidatus Hydrogenisulfobacillus filiaventi TaxID=2707344 RepID=A0A6F8ZIK5_9FIRM|nr:putative Rieske domain-containing protein [Candidatus Hydrogenisulfobacillus filiaventi]